MNSYTKLIRGDVPGTFCEPECVIEHEGQQYAAGGAWIGRHRETGRLGGLLYASRTDGRPTHVASWGGEVRVPARFLREWRSNLGDLRQAVYFELEGRPFYGVWHNKEWSDVVRCRELASGKAANGT